MTVFGPRVPGKLKHFEELSEVEALAHVDHHLAQQADARELVQRVVDGGERHRDARGAGLVEQLLGRDVPRPALHEQLGQRQALPGRAQPRRLQLLQNSRVGPRRLHRLATLAARRAAPGRAVKQHLFGPIYPACQERPLNARWRSDRPAGGRSE